VSRQAEQHGGESEGGGLFKQRESVLNERRVKHKEETRIAMPKKKW